MHIASRKGDFECTSWTELESFIKQCSLASSEDLWLYKETDYPCLSILLNGSYACIHYFLNDEGDLWQSVGDGELDVSFVTSNGDLSVMPADCILSLADALHCAKQSYDTSERPDCIQWREL